MRNRRPKQHKVSMALMEKLIEDLYKAPSDTDASPDAKDTPVDVPDDAEFDKFSELF